MTAGLLRQAPETGLDGDTDFWTEWQSPKQNSATNPDEDQQAHLQLVLSGVSVHLQTEQQPSAGPDGEVLPDTDCRGTAACSEESRLLFSLGQRVAAARSLCIGGHTLATDDTLLKTMAVLEASQLALLLHNPLNSWIDATTSEQRCAAVDTVIGRALSGVVK